jgi:hypothetical protein
MTTQGCDDLIQLWSSNATHLLMDIHHELLDYMLSNSSQMALEVQHQIAETTLAADMQQLAFFPW